MEWRAKACSHDETLGVSKLVLRPIFDAWYRAIPSIHWSTALSTRHSTKTISRFGSGGADGKRVEILYLAENHAVALHEVGDLLGPPAGPIANPRAPKISLLDIGVRLQSVVDLTQPAHLNRIQTSLQELTGAWEEIYPPGLAPTHKLGAALFAAENVEGFLTLSSKMPRCKTLVVFPQKLRAESELLFKDPILKKTHRVAGR